MKKFKQGLLPLTAALLAFVISADAYAQNTQAQNNTELVYPPTEAEQSLQYPPAMPQVNQQMPYIFGRQAPLTTPMVPPSPYYAPPTQQPRIAPSASFTNRAYPNLGYPPVYRQRNNNTFPFSNNMPFSGNSFGMPSNPMNSFFGNNNNGNNHLPFFKQRNTKRKKAWGDERNIWPDFYTDFTDDAWDTVMSGPRDLGRMPGGWRFPYISMPDPVTVSDAVVNQFPPIVEEAGNMADVSDWGVFENKK